MTRAQVTRLIEYKLNQQAPGVSPFSRNLDNLLFKEQRQKLPPSTILVDARRTILELFHENNYKGWDGYDASPVMRASVEQAIRLVELLPSDLPLPEITADPEGEITLEWYANGNSYTISCGVKDKISYAAIFKDGSEHHGKEPYAAQLTTTTLTFIKKVYR